MLFSRVVGFLFVFLSPLVVASWCVFVFVLLFCVPLLVE